MQHNSLGALPPRGGLAIGAALALVPFAAVLQNRATAPIALLAFAGAVLLAWRGGWRPSWRPRGPALPLVCLLGWMLAASAWAIEPGRGIDTTVRLAAMLGLAWLAAQALRGGGVPGWAAPAGVALGLAAAGLDAATGNALRALVRGLSEPPASLAFGLKNAAAVLALLLPLGVGALAAKDRRFGFALAAFGAAVVLALPGESAKLAVLVGLAAMGAAWFAPRSTPRALGAGLAALILAAPLAATLLLRPGLDASRLPESAAHRLMVWDFVASEVWAAPVLGHGTEASRALPGGRDNPGAARLLRFGLDKGRAAGWIATSELLPLHPHNLALQLWLELGLVGAALAAWFAWALGAAAARSPSPPAAAGALAAGGVVAMLSYGAWQHWWVAALALAAVALSAASPTRRTP